MNGSDFVKAYASTGLPAWEGAALELARQGALCPWPWVDVPLSDDHGNTAVLSVRSDAEAVGTLEDHVRLPMLPSTAQAVANVTPGPDGTRGCLLPTPWLAYQIWRAAPAKLDPVTLPNNVGASLLQWAQHSALVDQELGAMSPPAGSLVAGIGKHVVVSNLMLPGHVVIFGWYRPSPPAPDVFDDRQPQSAPNRQPIQPHSNLHAAAFVDYSHVVQLVAPVCTLNGQRVPTLSLYQHPALSSMVSHDGPVRTPRYPYRPDFPPPTPSAVASAQAGPQGLVVVPLVPRGGLAPTTAGRRGPVTGRNW
jgi:hypothetical protein